MSHFSWQIAELDDQWDDFIHASPEGNLFCLSTYLKALQIELLPVWCLKGEQKCAAMVFCLDSKQKKVSIAHELMIYQGICHAAPDPFQNQAQYHSDCFAAAEYLAQTFMEYFDAMHLALTPGYRDLRPFLWTNYGSRPQYQLELRYTSYLNLKELDVQENFEQSKYFHQMNTLRKRELRAAYKQNIVIQESEDVDSFSQYYLSTMQRQGCEIDVLFNEQMLQVMRILLQKKQGFLLEALSSDHERTGMLFCGTDHRRGYYLFGGNDSSQRHLPTGTPLFWETLHQCHQRGLSEFDFEGINSPKRGWFKLGFGGDIRPYYWVIKSSGGSYGNDH